MIDLSDEQREIVEEALRIPGVEERINSLGLPSCEEVYRYITTWLLVPGSVLIRANGKVSVAKSRYPFRQSLKDHGLL